MFVYSALTFSNAERNIRESKPDNDPATPNALAPSTIYNLGPIPGTVNVIWAVANFNEYPRGGACCRYESRHEKQRGQQKSKFMFHSLFNYFV